MNGALPQLGFEPLEEISYPITPQDPEPELLEIGAVINVPPFVCRVEQVIPHPWLVRYRAQVIDGADLQTIWLWFEPQERLAWQRRFFSALVHPFLPQALAWHEDTGGCYGLYSFSAGLTLDQKAQSTPWRELLDIYLELVQGFKAIHQAGWAMLGLTPQDINVEPTMLLQEVVYVTPIGEVPLDAIYTLGYSAPELLRPQPITGQEDIYTLGMILYRLVTGQNPPEGGIDRLNLPPQVHVPGVIQILGRTLGPANERCTLDDLLAMVQNLKNQTPEPGIYTYEVAGATTQGLNFARLSNQDAWGYQSKGGSNLNPNRCLVCVADGIGGMAQGELAARLAVAAFLEDQSTTDLDQLSSTLGQMTQANAAVYAAIGGRGGTTLTGVVLWGNRLTLAHIGDSRAYVIQPASCLALTEDHSLTQHWVKQGIMEAQEAQHHTERNQILKFVGEYGLLPPDYMDTLKAKLAVPWLELTPETVVYFCTDGVWELVSPEQVAVLLQGESNLQRAANGIIDLVLAQGAPDNATVVLVRCT